MCKREYGNANIFSQGGNALNSQSGNDNFCALGECVACNPQLFSGATNTPDTGMPNYDARRNAQQWATSGAAVIGELPPAMASDPDMAKWTAYTQYVIDEMNKLGAQPPESIEPPVSPASSSDMAKWTKYTQYIAGQMAQSSEASAQIQRDYAAQVLPGSRLKLPETDAHSGGKGRSFDHGSGQGNSFAHSSGSGKGRSFASTPAPDIGAMMQASKSVPMEPPRIIGGAVGGTGHAVRERY